MTYKKARAKAKKHSETAGEPCGIWEWGKSFTVGSWEKYLKTKREPLVWFESGNISDFDPDLLSWTYI